MAGSIVVAERQVALCMGTPWARSIRVSAQSSTTPTQAVLVLLGGFFKAAGQRASSLASLCACDSQVCFRNSRAITSKLGQHGPGLSASSETANATNSVGSSRMAKTRGCTTADRSGAISCHRR
eukprot:TRINITY_DN52694_c2_g2_i2.p1 TRINITY_DN52694_c2_g2~~TRINITY_DN52694_c2_g2_i2.p1  ORF type:complete len:124 (+),score=5.87 TRINITY_DN52694_c2_g2_i2:188-559(+)